MDTMKAIQEYETTRNANQKAELLQALIDDDARFVKRLGNPYVKDARTMARQGVIKLPRGF